jgi:hypothetical protein
MLLILVILLTPLSLELRVRKMANPVREQSPVTAEDPEADGADRRQDRESRNRIHLQEKRLPEHGNHRHRLQAGKLNSVSMKAD